MMSNCCPDICEASHKGCLECIDIFQDDIDKKDNDGYSALHRAIMNRQGETIYHLIALGADIEIEDSSGYTPLHYVAKDGLVDYIPLFINQCTNINKMTAYQDSALHLASEYGHNDCIESLLFHGADVNDTKPCDGKTPLHVAASNGCEWCISTLIEGGGDLKAKDHRDQLPLFCAVQAGYHNCIKLLINDKVNSTTKNKDGQTALHVASEKGRNTCIIELLKNGSNINEKDNAGKTPLQYAVSCRCNAINYEGYCGRNVSDHVTSCRHNECIITLLEHGADISVKNVFGATPFDIANKEGEKLIEDFNFVEIKEPDHD